LSVVNKVETKELKKWAYYPALGRLFNLFNTAFYAVNEKAKVRATSCEPRVIAATKKIIKRVEIKVSYNGNGIPKNIVVRYSSRSLPRSQKDREQVWVWVWLMIL